MSREIWIVAEFTDGEVDACSTMVAVHAARLAEQLPGILLRGLAILPPAGEDSGIVEQLAKLGITRVSLIRQAHGYERSIAGLIEREAPWVLLVPGTHSATAIASRLASALDLPLVPDCTELGVQDNRLSFGMTIAGGMAVVDTYVNREVCVIAVMPMRDAPDFVPESVVTPEVEAVASEDFEGESGIEELDFSPVAPGDISLAEAQLIVSGGRGIGGPEGFEPLFELARLVDGHVGASRVTTDLGWISKEHLVGMSGATVRPSIYLALGISGDPHHLMGMRDSTVIVAVNTDPKAPIFKIAQHALVCEAEPVVRRTIERLSEMRAN